MAIRLTVSRLRQIIREEASKLIRRPRNRSRRLRESAFGNLNLPQAIQEIIALMHPEEADLDTIRDAIEMGDAEGAMDALLYILGGAEDDPYAGEMASEVTSQISSMASERILSVLSQVEEFSAPPD